MSRDDGGAIMLVAAFDTSNESLVIDCAQLWGDWPRRGLSPFCF